MTTQIPDYVAFLGRRWLLVSAEPALYDAFFPLPIDTAIGRSQSTALARGRVEQLVIDKDGLWHHATFAPREAAPNELPAGVILTDEGFEYAPPFRMPFSGHVVIERATPRRDPYADDEPPQVRVDFENGRVAAIHPRGVPPPVTLAELDEAGMADRLRSDPTVYLGRQAVHTTTRWLDVSGDGTVPARLPPLPPANALEHLDLAGTPVTDIAALRDAVHLEMLDLSRTRVSDLTPLRDLPALRTLRLGGVDRAVDLTPLASIPKLAELDLQGSATDLTILRALPRLETLDVSETAFDDFGLLAGMSNLSVLRLAKTRLARLVPAPWWPSLDHLDINATSISDLSMLACAPRLSSLYIAHTPVASLLPVASCSELVALDACGTAVDSLAPLSANRALTRLAVGDTRVSDLAPVLGRRLTSLNVSGTPLRDLSSLRELEQSLTFLTIDDGQLASLCALSGLVIKTLTIRAAPGATIDLGLLRSLRLLETLELPSPVSADWSVLPKLRRLRSLVAPWR